MEYLKTHIERESEWDEHLPMAMFSYNTSVHEGTKFTLYELVFGRLPRLSSYVIIEGNLEPTYQEYLKDLFNRLQNIQEEARKNLIRSKEMSKYYYDKRNNPQTFKEGDNVFLLKEPTKGKFSEQYTGPYEIIEVLPNNNVKILYRKKHRIVHTDKLKLSRLDPR